MGRIKENKAALALFITILALIVFFIVGTILLFVQLEGFFQSVIAEKGELTSELATKIESLRLRMIFINVTVFGFICALSTLGFICSFTGRCRIGTIVLGIILIPYSFVMLIIFLSIITIIPMTSILCLGYLIFGIVILALAINNKETFLATATIEKSQIESYKASNMEILYEIDSNDYDSNLPVVNKIYAKVIIIEDNKIGVIYSKNYDFYHLPTVMSNDLKNHENLLTESLKNRGLNLVPNSFKGYGIVNKRQKNRSDELEISKIYYYFMNVKNQDFGIKSLISDDETFEWVNAKDIIDVNLTHDHKEKNVIKNNIEQEIYIIKRLKDDGYVF